MLGQFPAMVVATDLRDPTRDVVVESKDKVACGASGRRLRPPRCCGKRAFCTASVDAEGIARVFHSTGRVHRPARSRRERRGCRGRARCSVLGAMSLPVACSCRLLSRINLKQRRDATDKQERTKDGRRKEDGTNNHESNKGFQPAGRRCRQQIEDDADLLGSRWKLCFRTSSSLSRLRRTSRDHYQAMAHTTWQAFDSGGSEPG